MWGLTYDRTGELNKYDRVLEGPPLTRVDAHRTSDHCRRLESDGRPREVSPTDAERTRDVSDEYPVEPVEPAHLGRAELRLPVVGAIGAVVVPRQLERARLAAADGSAEHVTLPPGPHLAADTPPADGVDLVRGVRHQRGRPHLPLPA